LHLLLLPPWYVDIAPMKTSPATQKVLAPDQDVQFTCSAKAPPGRPTRDCRRGARIVPQLTRRRTSMISARVGEWWGCARICAGRRVSTCGRLEVQSHASCRVLLRHACIHARMRVCPAVCVCVCACVCACGRVCMHERTSACKDLPGVRSICPICALPRAIVYLCGVNVRTRTRTQTQRHRDTETHGHTHMHTRRHTDTQSTRMRMHMYMHTRIYMAGPRCSLRELSTIRTAGHACRLERQSFCEQYGTMQNQKTQVNQ